jgi:hypothetical protein
MAEGIFQSIAKDAKYKGKIGAIDSCGTGEFEVLFAINELHHHSLCTPLPNALH